VPGDLWYRSNNLYYNNEGTIRAIAHTGSWSAMSVAEGQTATATSNRFMRAANLKQIIDYHARRSISLATTGSSGASTYNNSTGVLNVPNYTLAGLGGVPTGRTITINGTGFDLSANRTYTINTLVNAGTVTSQDWNTIIPSNAFGFAEVSAYSGANGPSPAYTYGVVLHASGSSSAFQLYSPEQAGANDRGLWYRSGYSGDFGSWKRVLEMDVAANVGTALGSAGARFQIASSHSYNTAAGTMFDIAGAPSAHNDGRLYGFRQKLENFGSSNARGVSLATYGLQYVAPVAGPPAVPAGSVEIFLSRIHNNSNIYTHQIGGNGFYMYPTTAIDTSFTFAFPRLNSSGTIDISVSEHTNPNTIPSTISYDALWRIKYGNDSGTKANIIQVASVTLELRTITRTTSGAYTLSYLDLAHARVRVTTGTTGVSAEVTMPNGTANMDGKLFTLELEATSGTSSITALSGNTNVNMGGYTDTSSITGPARRIYMMMWSQALSKWLVYGYFE
jgi:hypothetical protein